MNEKQTYIDELERLDDLFKTIIHNTSFSQEIKQMIKDGCNEISDLTNRLKLQENGNKKSIEMQLNNSKKQIRNYNNSKNRTSQYNNYNIDAYFLDEKK